MPTDFSSRRPSSAGASRWAQRRATLTGVLPCLLSLGLGALAGWIAAALFDVPLAGSIALGALMAGIPLCLSVRDLLMLRRARATGRRPVTPAK